MSPKNPKFSLMEANLMTTYILSSFTNAIARSTNLTCSLNGIRLGNLYAFNVKA